MTQKGIANYGTSEEWGERNDVRGYQYYIHTYPWLVGNDEADRDRAAVSVWAGDIITFVAASSNGGEERGLLLLLDVASPTLSPFKLDAITSVR
jgi:hypothetical protein